MGDLRRHPGDGIAVSLGIGGTLVPKQKALQGVRREASLGSDHFQHRLRLLLQPLTARPLRDYPRLI